MTVVDDGGMALGLMDMKGLTKRGGDLFFDRRKMILLKRLFFTKNFNILISRTQ